MHPQMDHQYYSTLMYKLALNPHMAQCRTRIFQQKGTLMAEDKAVIIVKRFCITDDGIA